MTLDKLCEAVILANKLHNESYVARTPQSYGKHSRSWDDCVDQATGEVFGTLYPQWRSIVWFLAISGEGVDICRGLSEGR